MFNTFTAGAIFRSPPRNVADTFIRHAESTLKMPMTYILVINYLFRNANEEISRHSDGFDFFFISTLRLIFTLVSVHFVILVIFFPYLLKIFCGHFLEMRKILYEVKKNKTRIFKNKIKNIPTS